jgi:hypothetical protein
VTGARTTVEQKIIHDHTEWMQQNAGGLRLLDTRHLITQPTYENEILRRRTISELGSQIALDAFKRGLAVIALAKPQYLVHPYMAAGHSGIPHIGPEPEWMTVPPVPGLIDSTWLVEIKVEAYGFPIGIREV